MECCKLARPGVEAPEGDADNMFHNRGRTILVIKPGFRENTGSIISKCETQQDIICKFLYTTMRFLLEK